MSKGNIDDPKMNSVEEDYGILIVTETDRNGLFKQITYLKDKNSRHFTFGTPVKFTMSDAKLKAKLDECPTEEDDIEINSKRQKIALEVATNVVLDEDEIKKHPVVSNLNIYAKVLLRLRDEGKLDLLLKVDSCDIEDGLTEIVEKLISNLEPGGAQEQGPFA